KVPVPTGQLLAGSYGLDTAIFVNSGATEDFTPPVVQGSLVLTAATYKVHVVEDTSSTGNPGDTVVVLSDSGTYTITDTTMVARSSAGSQTSIGVTFAGSVNLVRQSSATSGGSETTLYWGRNQ